MSAPSLRARPQARPSRKRKSVLVLIFFLWVEAWAGLGWLGLGLTSIPHDRGPQHGEGSTDPQHDPTCRFPINLGRPIVYNPKRYTVLYLTQANQGARTYAASKI